MRVRCKDTGADFSVSPAELALRQKLAPKVGGETFPLPLPSRSPDARLQRRLAWRSELHLFFRTSDRSGERILSYLPPGADSVVYSLDEWLSDDWDAVSYGRDYDPNRPFFEQFLELRRAVPQPGMAVQFSEHSDYVNNTSYCKNCYLIAGCNYAEECLYGTFLNNSVGCVDSCFVHHCQYCYDCLDCSECYRLQHCWNCFGCSDSMLLHSCRSSKNCFGSVNLVRKEYVFFNEQLTREDYEQRLRLLRLDTTTGRQAALARFEAHRVQYPYRSQLGEMNEQASGNMINQSRRCFECFDATALEDCAHCIWFHKATDSLDCYSWGLSAELCYECVAVGSQAVRNLCCSNCFASTDVLYSHQLRSCKDCFGCASLRRKQYCVLNRQYSRVDYEALVSEIIKNMIADGEWGEFFPPSVSPLAYNDSAGADYFPLSEKEAIARGFRWRPVEEQPRTSAVPSAPDSIADVPDEICDTPLICRASGRPFRVTSAELRYYRNYGIPLPQYHWEERHRARIARRLPWTLWERECERCHMALSTAFSPERQEIVYCEKCWSEAAG